MHKSCAIAWIPSSSRVQGLFDLLLHADYEKDTLGKGVDPVLIAINIVLLKACKNQQLAPHKRKEEARA